MTRSWFASIVLASGVAASGVAHAEAAPGGTTAPTATTPPGQEESAKVNANAPPAALEEIVRGVYFEMRAGGGYGVVGTKLPNDPAYPTLGGTSEMLGGGPLVDLAVGVELGDVVALQALGGVALIGNRRDDRVRAISLAYGGAGLRLNLPLSERFVFRIAPGAAYARSDNLVEPATTGLLISLGLGFEYYVHVRHFSLGVDLTGLVPVSPLRVYLGLAPHIRYTF